MILLLLLLARLQGYVTRRDVTHSRRHVALSCAVVLNKQTPALGREGAAAKAGVQAAGWAQAPFAPTEAHLTQHIVGMLSVAFVARGIQQPLSSVRLDVVCMREQEVWPHAQPC